jgi:DNA polymerase-1
MSSGSHKQLAIIDGHALAFRSFHALAGAGLRSSRGEPTYAIYGFIHFLLTMIQEKQPDYVAVAFDVGRTFRHEEYADYKAGRAETPEEFHPQLERIQQILRALGVPIYTAEGYEADDVIGTLAQQATRQDIYTTILTGDTDTLQLVTEHVQVLLANPHGRNMNSTLYGMQEVHERYKGLEPAQLADLRGLKGDASDNIPGVRGIGETGAITLLNQFHTVEGIYEHLEDVPKRYRKHLEDQREQALFSKWLATIVCDVPVTFDASSSALGKYDRTEVMNLFHEMEFLKLVNKLPFEITEGDAAGTAQDAVHHRGLQDEHAQQGITPDIGQLSLFDDHTEWSAERLVAERRQTLKEIAVHGTYHAVVTAEALDEVVEALQVAPAFAFDTESTGIDPFQDDIVGISLAVVPGSAWYIPFGHRSGTQLPREQVVAKLRTFFEDPDKPTYAHNAKFDIEMLTNVGIAVQGLAFDTMIAAGLLGKRMGLKDLAFSELRLPEPMDEIETLIGRGAKQVGFDEVSIERALPYAAADADMTLRLVEMLQPQLANEPRIERIFQDIELPLVPVLADMERAGIRLNGTYLRELSERLKDEIAQLETQIHELAGEPFNINSTQQMNRIFFEKLNLPTEGLRKTSTGQYSLTADVLEKLSDSHEVVRLILEYRHLAKLKSTYVDALPKLVHPETERVHTSFNQMGTTTGRLASSSPNLQNIPVRTETGSEIRRAFVAAEGHTFIAADYSQIELRVLAHITKDPNLIQAFLDGQDIHAATASLLFNVPLDEVDKEQRRIAKTTVFGIIYGISSFGLAQRTDLSRSEAQALIDAFFARFPGVQSYITSTLEQGRKQGYVESLFGRRRMMPDLNSSGPRRQAAEREAINAPIQATAADLMKMAMIHVARAIQQRGLRTRMVLQVHDELIFETPLEESPEVQAMVRQEMESVYDLDVPLKVDVEVGKNWEHMHEVKQAV